MIQTRMKAQAAGILLSFVAAAPGFAAEIELRFDTLRITWKRLKRKPAELARQLRAILAARDPHARR